MTPLLLALLSTASAASLWVPTTPQTPKPYAIKNGHGLPLGGGNTFPVTGNSSGGAFCILNTNAAGSFSVSPGLFPHVHRKTYENFYAVKGRVQLWGQNVDSFRANTSIQTTRVLSQGDIGAIPPNTIHTFTLLEPDTQLTGVLVPGGFEEFFFAMAVNPNPGAGGLPGAGGFDMEGLAKWDVYPELAFTARRDVVNGKAGPGNWYDGPNALPGNMDAPIWVAKNYGPKWLSEEGGRYQIVAPFVRGVETNGTFSQGTITISEQRGPVGKVKSEVATAFMLEEGELEVRVEGFDAVRLVWGDVVFVPGGVGFEYEAKAQFTKFMYVTGGGKGLDWELIQKGRTWNSAFFPRGQSGGRMMRI
ncbi:RmlC-like cupin domain-containing protein [Immersiella caudata]|uniref:RmlC-like cupin domain-containing protein n=1 Tax=Immersiella caudata TaxID=314043 RepID=A0AA39WWQ5_9PEZI|nr:RmlC-like cupin domain-containing protein [Immersiella caudata]